MKKKNLSNLVAMAVLLGGVSCSSRVWAEGTTIKIQYNSTSSPQYTITPDTYGGGFEDIGWDYYIIYGVKDAALGANVTKIQTGTGAEASAIPVEVYGIRAVAGSVTATSITNGIDVRSSDYKSAYAIHLESTGTNSIQGLGNIKVVSDLMASGIRFMSGTSAVEFDSTGGAAGTITVNGRDGAFGIAFGDPEIPIGGGTGAATVRGLDSISVEAIDHGVYGIFSRNANDVDGDEFKVEFVAAGGTIKAYGGTAGSGGIYFASADNFLTEEVEPTGKSKVLNVKSIVAGENIDGTISTGSSSGISAAAGINNVDFVADGTITVKSNGGDKRGISIRGGTTTVSNLGGTTDGIIISGTGGTNNAKIEMTKGTLNLSNSVVKATDDVYTVYMQPYDTSYIPVLNLQNNTKVYGSICSGPYHYGAVNIDATSELHVNSFETYHFGDVHNGALNVVNNGKFFVEGKLDMSDFDGNSVYTSTITLNDGSGIYFVTPTGFNKDSDTLLKMNTAFTINNGVGVYVNTSNLTGLKEGDVITLVDAGSGNVLTLGNNVDLLVWDGSNYVAVDKTKISVNGTSLEYSVVAVGKTIEIQTNGKSQIGGIETTNYSATDYVGVDGKKALGSNIDKIKTVDGGVASEVYGIKIGSGISFTATSITDGIDVKSTNDNAYGIYLAGTSADIQGLGSITVESSDTGNYKGGGGIFIVEGTNKVVFSGSDSSIMVSSSDYISQGISIVNSSCNTILSLKNIVSKGSASSYGILLGNGTSYIGTDSTGSTGKELTSIKAGFTTDSDIQAGIAYGIAVSNGTNTIAFGTGSSITAKSSADDVYGIFFAVKGLSAITTARGTTTVTGLGNITVNTAGSSKTAYGIYSMSGDMGSSDPGNLNISFKGNGGQAITATNTTTPANAYSIYTAGGYYGTTTVNFENSILSGKVHQENQTKLNLNFNDGGVWNPATGDVEGTVAVSVNDGGKIKIDKKTDLTGGTVNVTTVSGGDLEFVLPSDFSKTSDTMLKLNTSINIGSGVGVYVNSSALSGLSDGDEIILLDVGALKTITLGTTILKVTTDGTNYTNAIIEVDGQKLIYTVGTPVQPVGKIIEIQADGKSKIGGTVSKYYSGTSFVGADGKRNLGAAIDLIKTADDGVADNVYGIMGDGEKSISITSLKDGINIKSTSGYAYGVYLAGKTNEINNIGNIRAIAEVDAYGYCAYGTEPLNSTVKFKENSCITAKGKSDSYGIYFGYGTNNIGTTGYELTGIKAGFDDDGTSSGWNVGINIYAGTNKVAFSGVTSSIEAKSTGSDVYGIAYGYTWSGSSYTATGTTEVTGLGKIIAETTSTDNNYKTAYGIYACNGNDPDGSDKFSVSFVNAGGSISVYSENGDNFGIKFEKNPTVSQPTGTSEVKNVKTITAGVKSGAPSTISSKAAGGIVNVAGTNSVVFKENGSITAKSSGNTAFGIAMGGGTLTVSNLGGTTDGITVEGSKKSKIVWEGYGTLNLKKSTIKATDDVTTVACLGAGNMNLSEGTKVYGPVNVYSGSSLTVGVEDSTSEWHINKFDGPGAMNVTNNGKFFVEGKLDLSGTTSSITSNSGSGIYFVIPSDFDKTTDTMLKLNSDLSIGSGVGIYVNTKSVSGLAKGDKITLADVGSSNTLSLDSTTLEFTVDGTNYYAADIQVEGQKLIYTVGDTPAPVPPSGGDTDKKKAPVEGMAAANAAVNTSTDLALGAGMSNLIASTAGVSSADTFGATSYGKSRLNSGSHVDTRGYGIVVGAGKKVFNKAGNKTTGGVFFEYGNSDFDTYNHAVTGTGKSINKGLGYMMRYDHTCGNYYEGMLHGGKVATNWSRNGSTDAYDMNPTYFGGALTYGHKFMVEKEGQLSVYGSYIYTRTGGGDAKIGGHDYSFGATNSHRTRTGVRYAMSDLMDTKKFRPYAGLAWEHEFNGETTATVRGLGEAPAPSMKGDSGILELGCKQEVGKWTLGIGMEAFTGKRRGWNGTLQATYNF